MGRTSDYNVRVGIILKNFDKELKAAESKLRAFSDRAAATGRDLSLLISAPIIGAGGAALRGAIEFDRLNKALEAISGSSEAAQAQLADLRKIAELPGISFEQATKASIQLQGLGFSADRARTAIVGVGNAIATSGGTQAQFEGAIRQISQIQAKGRVLQEDITILLENMPVLGKLLQDTFGGSTAEAIRATGVSGGEFVDILLEKLNELPKVQTGLANAFENVGIAARFAFASIGQEIDRIFGLQQIFEKLGQSINRAADIFKSLDDSTKKSIVRLAAFGAAIGPVLVIGGRIVGAFSGIVAALNAITASAAPTIRRMQGLTVEMIPTEAQAKRLRLALLSVRAAMFGIIGIGIALALVPIIKAWREAGKAIDEASRAATEAQKAMGEAIKEAEKETQGAISSVKAYAEIVQDETRAQNERVAALRKLKSEYPGYFDALKEDLTNTNLLAGAVQKLSQNLVSAAKARALQNKAQEQADKLVDLEDSLTDALINQELARSRASKAGIDASVDLAEAYDQLRRGQLDTTRLTKQQVQAIISQGDAYSVASQQVSALSERIKFAQSTLEQFASKAAEFEIKTEGSKIAPLSADDPAAERAAKEAAKRQRQIDRIYNDALGKISAIDQAASTLGTTTLTRLQQQSQVAAKALKDLFAKGLGEDDTRVQDLAGRFRDINRELVLLQAPVSIAAVDFAKFAKEADKDAVKLVKRIEEIAEKSALLKEPGVELKTLSALFSDAAKRGKDFEDVFQGAFKQAQADGLKRQTEQVGSFFEKLRKQSEALSEEVNKKREAEGLKDLQNTIEGLTQSIQPLQTGLESFFTSVFEGGANSFGAFAASLGQSLKKMIAQLAAAAAAAAALSFLISTLLPGIGLGNLAGGLTKSLTGDGGTSLIQGLLRRLGVPFFAQGGIVTRPMLGVVGEAGPEAIIPLDKLKDFQGQGGELRGEVVIRGTDLAILLERANNQRRRSRGI
jgi:tape measure domain-containing protein